MNTGHADLRVEQVSRDLEGVRAHLAHLDVPGPDASFLERLMYEQAQDEVVKLTSELAVVDHGFAMGFSDVAEPAKHSMSTTLLSNLLSRFQSAITFAGWARLAGPGVHGRPPSFVARTLETQVETFAPGSFLVELSPNVLAIENEIMSAALSDLLVFARAGSGNDEITRDEALEDLAQSLGTEATRRFAHFFAKLHEAHLETRFEWSWHPEESVVLKPEGAQAIAVWLKAVEPMFDTLTVSGILTAADANEGRFAVTDSAGEIHEGKAAKELLSHAVIDERYKATMRVTTFTSVATNTAKVRAVLEDLERLP